MRPFLRIKRWSLLLVADGVYLLAEFDKHSQSENSSVMVTHTRTAQNPNVPKYVSKTSDG